MQRGEIELEHVGFVQCRAALSPRRCAQVRIASRSISIASQRRQRSSSGSVSAPRPGPISTMRSPGLRIDRRDDALDHAGIVQEMLAEALARNVDQARCGASCSARSIAVEQAARIGPAGAGEVERRAVIDRRADERQAERHVDGAARSRRT